MLEGEALREHLRKETYSARNPESETEAEDMIDSLLGVTMADNDTCPCCTDKIGKEHQHVIAHNKETNETRAFCIHEACLFAVALGLADADFKW